MDCTFARVKPWSRGGALSGSALRASLSFLMRAAETLMWCMACSKYASKMASEPCALHHKVLSSMYWACQPLLRPA